MTLLRTTFALLPLALGAGCSAGTTSPPLGTINVTFPSVHAAIASDTLELHVFDASSPDTCIDLVQKRRTGQVLPKGLIDRTPVPTCDFLAGKSTPLDIAYGRRAFLVVAQRQAQDLLIGCTIQGVGDAPILVDVALITKDAMTSVPASSCVKLSDYCSGACKN